MPDSARGMSYSHPLMLGMRRLSIPKISCDGETMTTREQEILEDIRQTVSGFAERLRGYRVVLFGSRAAGMARPRSDFDIGVDGSAPLPLKTFYDLAGRLDELRTLYRIDWVDLRRVSPAFRTEALKHCQEIFHATTTVD